MQRALLIWVLLGASLGFAQNSDVSAGIALGPYTITTVCQNCGLSNLNDFGQVVGTYSPPSPLNALLWQPNAANSPVGTLFNLPGLPTGAALQNGAEDINNFGEVVGYSEVNGEPQKWIWIPDVANGTTGATTQLFLLGFAPMVLNSDGQVGEGGLIWGPSSPLGNAGFAGLISNAVVWLTGLNSFGQALVLSLSKAPPQLFTPATPNNIVQGGLTNFPGYLGASGASVYGINDHGTVVGTSADGKAVIWTPTVPNGTSGTYTLIPNPSGFSGLVPHAINAQGDVAGVMINSSTNTSVPFLYTGGVVYDLSTLNSSLLGMEADRINSSRQMILSTTLDTATKTGMFATVLATPQIIVSRTAPFGHIDTPVNEVGPVAGAVSITGWALSSPAITSVGLWREPIAGEMCPTGESQCLIFLGNATIVPGTRPDIAIAYPGYPFNTAGWGFELMTNELPNGNGTFTLHAIATNSAGQSTDLGAVALDVNNAASATPFGAIDTPAPGATISGTAYLNFGWALTPQPNTIPQDGSTIWVFIDNRPVGHPVYGFYRSDVATLFPGFNNSTGPVGYYQFDTTTLSNGFHTIAWSVTDNAGNTSGIGSRFFVVQN